MSIEIRMPKTQHSSGVLCLRGLLGDAAKIFTHPPTKKHLTKSGSFCIISTN